VNQVIFWFMMQIGMIVGFFTSYPINFLLIRAGWKEKMPQPEAETRNMIRTPNPGQQNAA
jgi:hypothetical protein